MFTAYRKDETEVHIRDRECPIIFQPKVWAVYWLLFYLLFLLNQVVTRFELTTFYYHFNMNQTLS